MIIEKTENGIYKMLDLSENDFYRVANSKKRQEVNLSFLPRKIYKRKEVVDWESCRGHEVSFKYKEKIGSFTVSYSHCKGGKHWVNIWYDNKITLIGVASLLNPKLGRIVGKHGKHKYKIGYVIKNSVVIELTQKYGEKAYVLKCLESGQVYTMTEHNLERNKNIPYAPKKYLKEFKELDIYIVNDRDKDLTHQSNQVIELRCPNCNTIKKSSVDQLVKRGFSCSQCIKKSSYPERFLKEYFDYHNIKYIAQKKFKDLPNRRFDFYLSELKAVVEVHGEQHFHPSFNAKDKEIFKKTVQRDKEKYDFCEKKGVKYFMIDARESLPDHISNSINFSGLPKITNDEVRIIAKKTESNTWYDTKLMKELFLRGISKTDIAKRFNISLGTLDRLYRQIGFDEAFITPRKVINVNTRVYFNSRTEAQRVMGGDLHKYFNGRISCGGKHAQTREHLHWEYLDEYIKKYGDRDIREYNDHDFNYKKVDFSSRKVVCCNTQQYFSSLKQASEWSEIAYVGISRTANSKQKSAGKHPVTGEPLKWMDYEDYVEKYGTEGLTEYVEEKSHN